MQYAGSMSFAAVLIAITWADEKSDEYYDVSYICGIRIESPLFSAHPMGVCNDGIKNRRRNG